MATVNPSIVRMFNEEPQDLATVQYTDSWRDGVDGVPFYVSEGSTVTVVFPNTGPSYGTDIDVNTNTGVITLNTVGDFVFELTATAFCNTAGAMYQWYNVDNESALGQAVPVGTPVSLVYLPADTANVSLRITAPEGTEFQYPAQITDASAIVQIASGFVA